MGVSLYCAPFRNKIGVRGHARHIQNSLQFMCAVCCVPFWQRLGLREEAANEARCRVGTDATKVSEPIDGVVGHLVHSHDTTLPVHLTLPLLR